MIEISIEEPFTKEKLSSLRAGDSVLLTGTIYMARDAAHKRMVEAITNGEKPPIDLENSIVYYAGPSPPAPGQVIGACGPTTSYRMDPYTDQLLRKGIIAMIGKGPRSEQVKEGMVREGAVYFAAIGGAGALISKTIVAAKVVAYQDLGAEAIREISVKNMPVIVAVDSKGNDLYRKD